MNSDEMREVTLSHEDILRLHEAAVKIGLPASRSALLKGLGPTVVASLPDAPTPAGQCLSDLHEIARAGCLPDGTIALAIWLRNALALVGYGPAAQVFEDALARVEPRDRDEERALRRAGLEDREDRFLSQVERICRLRQPSATITRRRAPVPFAGALEVSVAHGPIFVVDLVGALDHVITEEALEIFARKVDAPYRAGMPALRTTLVHGGSAAPVELIQRAYRWGILLTSYTEYQGLIDFGRYLDWQTRRLEQDGVYPPSLYVEQPAKISIGGREETATESALRAMWELLESPHPRFALILGDFGAGKTFLLHELARRMAVENHPLVPVLVEMRSLEKQRSLKALIAQHFASADVGRVDPDAFLFMLSEGRIVLLFDGFDELALRLNYDRALEHFDTLVEAAKGNAKIVVTSRTQHFLTVHQVKRALAERAEQLPGYRLVTIQPFGPAQIRQFLVNRLKDEREADQRFVLLDEVKDLLGLSKVPRLLGFIAEIEPEKLHAAREQAGEITSAKLYEVLVERWLDHEHERVNPPGAPRGIPRAGLRAAVTEIALLLWGRTGRGLSRDELASVAVPGAQTIDASVLAHQLGSGSLLVRDDDGAFSFLHQSVLEWLVADAAARGLAAGAEPAALQADAMTDLMADFFAALATPEAARGWAGRTLRGGEAGHSKDNALRLLRRLARGDAEEAITDDDLEMIEETKLAGQDLAGRDLTDADLRKADLAHADLRRATLVRARLWEASLAGARLARADLRGADLRGADLRGADLSFADLLGADLRGVKGPFASLRAAKLVGAKTDPISPQTLARLQADGVASPAPTRVEPMVASASGCNAVAWSPEGDMLVTGHYDGTVRLWDAVTGLAFRALPGHAGSVQSVAFSPDGLAIVSGSEDKTVRLWEVSSGRVLRIFDSHSSWVRSVVFSPEGKTLASGSEDNSVRLWEVSSGRALLTFKGHTNGVMGVAFGPDGKMLASASWDHTVRLWEVSSGRALLTFKGHTNGVHSVAFGPDGKTLVSASNDNTVRLWEVSSGRALLTFKFKGHTNRINSVAFGPDGKTLASGSEDKTVRLWEVSSGRALLTLEGHTDRVRSVAFSPDGKTLASGSGDKTVRLWEVSSGRALLTCEGHAVGVLSTVFGPDGKTLASGSLDNAVRLWGVSSGHLLRTFDGHTGWVQSVAIDPEGKTLASASDDKTVHLWEMKSGRALRVLKGHTGWVLSVAFGPDGKTLASGSWDNTVRLWEVSNGRTRRTFEGHTSLVQSVAFGPDGKTLASGSWDRTVRLWEVSSGRALRMFEGHTDWVLSVAFGPDGETLASGSGDKTVWLWDVRSGRALQIFEGHTNGVSTVAFGPDGKTLASGSSDATVRLWDVAAGRVLRTLEGHLGPVQQIAFHPGRRFLASVGADGIRLWDIASGTCLAVLLATPEGWAAFAPDGHYKLGGDIAGSFWHVIGLCRFEPGELDPYLPKPLRLADDAPLVPLP